MHDERSCPCPEAGVLSAATKDANAERGVLTLVVGDYPEVYTENELVREVTLDSEDFGERDTVERAIRSLAAVGLLHRCGPLVFPSRAALRFDALEELSER
jgi:hypothetical protein